MLGEAANVGGPGGDLTHHCCLPQGQTGILLVFDEVPLECCLEQLHCEASRVLEVTEVADLQELAGLGHLGPLLGDLLSGEVNITNTDSNLPVTTLTGGLVPPAVCRGLLVKLMSSRNG